MLVIGTAGHIDHGKSAIVKRLTGTDPDRLPEEKARGMTIDLGFAFRETPSGERIAFVDVPGHERFVRNMIAGAGGIDSVMLVVAADDGWMPQSQEHFQIVRLLGIEHGLVVINKTDLVDAEWLDLLEEDIREKVRGSFLADAPVFRVSAHTGEGIQALQEHLDELPSGLKASRDIGKARLYMDRSFVLTGIGGVVTGTLRGGSLKVGQPVAVWPDRVTGKVRSLHANDQEVSEAHPGHRTAVSLTGVDKDHLVRGGVITDRLDLNYYAEHPVLALSAEVLSEAAVSLEDRRNVLLVVGTTEVTGEIRLAGKPRVNPSESGIVFFKPDEPVYALVGDHYVLRLPTPMVTLGGGRILDHLRHVPRVKEMDRYAYLRDRFDDGMSSLVRSELQKLVVAPAKGLLANAAVSESAAAEAVAALVKESVLGSTGGNVFHIETFENAVDGFKGRLRTVLDANPHMKGLPAEQVMSLTNLPPNAANAVVNHLLSAGEMVKLGDKYNLVGRGMSLKGNIKKAHDDLMRQLREKPHTPPKLSQLAVGGKDYREAIKYIIESGEGYKCGSDFIFVVDAWDEIVAFIRQRLRDVGSMAVADLKDRFDITRKYAIPILEETDRLRLTRRDGDIRIRGDRFEEEESDH